MCGDGPDWIRQTWIMEEILQHNFRYATPHASYDVLSYVCRCMCDQKEIAGRAYPTCVKASYALS